MKKKIKNKIEYPIRLTVGQILLKYKPENIDKMEYDNVLSGIIWLYKLSNRKLFHELCGKDRRLIVIDIMKVLVIVKFQYEDRGEGSLVGLKKKCLPINISY